MNEVTCKILYDNCKENDDLQAGWGFSTLIEAGDHTLLFDTGNDAAAFFSNAKKMGIDYHAITDVVFSHKHKDHITGYAEILKKLREDVRIFVPPGFQMKGIPSKLRVQTVPDFAVIGDNIFSLVLRGGFFLKEQALILEMDKGLVVVTGCAHPGIVQILKAAQDRLKKPLYCVLGGFHIFRKTRGAVTNIVKEFQDLQVQQVAPCHCSGAHAIAQFQEAYSNSFYKIGTGSVLKIT